MKLKDKSIQSFYSSPIGKSAQCSLVKSLMPWVSCLSRDSNIMGIGHIAPLKKMLKDFQNFSIVKTLNQKTEDCSIDAVIIMHLCKQPSNEEHLIENAWRVLSSSGDLFFLTPNRYAFWRFFNKKPFKYGRPYSKQQLISMLEGKHFAIEAYKPVLTKLPFMNYFINLVWNPFCTMHLIHAKKHLFRPILDRNKQNNSTMLNMFSSSGVLSKTSVDSQKHFPLEHF